MTSNTTQNVPGMIYPTQKGFAPGAGNPRDSAMQQMAAVNTKQANLNAAVGGSKKRSGGTIVIPQYQMQYAPQGGPGTDPNAQITGNLRTSTQGTANAVYDKQALKTTGGSRKKRKGGNPNWVWGCYSGGRKSRRTRKTKRSKRSTKRSKRRG